MKEYWCTTTRDPSTIATVKNKTIAEASTPVKKTDTVIKSTSMKHRTNMMTVEMTSMIDRSATDATLPAVCKAVAKPSDPSSQSATTETIEQYIAIQENNPLAGQTQKVVNMMTQCICTVTS